MSKEGRKKHYARSNYYWDKFCVRDEKRKKKKERIIYHSLSDVENYPSRWMEITIV